MKQAQPLPTWPRLIQGYIRLYRSLASHPLWNHGRFSWAQAWIDLLFEAAWKDSHVLWGSRWIDVKRGQLLTTQVCLAKRWHWERKSVKSFLEALKADLMLSTVTVTAGDTPYTLITISNYDKFQADIEEPSDTAADARWEALGTRSSPKNGHGDGRPRDTRTDTKVKNIRSNKKPSVFWSDFILQFTSEDKAVLTNTLSAISSTRKSGRIAENVQNGIAGRLSSFPQSVVLAGCRTYLQKNYAAEGKNENYLIGIIRNLSNKGSHPVQPAKTPGQIAIDAAARELLEV